MQVDAVERDAHLNLVESSLRLFELDPGAEIERGAGWAVAAGRASHPLISNAAFRLDDGVEAGLLIERAKEFFGSRERGFAVWARSGVEADGGLFEAAERHGLADVYGMPEMVLGRRAEEPRVGPGIELRRVTRTEDAHDYWRVAIAAYPDIGFPPEVFSFYENHERLWSDGVAAFLAHADGEPAAIAMTIVNHGVAGIYWVGCTREARGRGLGRALTATAVNAGFDLGAEIASLQASPMGKPVYLKMGFETIFEYRLLAPPLG
jgi:GNAT superfamily N-acetyltransferase